MGLSAYYKIAQNLLDEGQFGAPISLTSFNYGNAIVKGVEFNASYDEGPWSVYFNGAYGSGIGTNINSAQFNFGANELAYIANHYITLDHSQGWTMSSGAAYTFNPDKDWATRISTDLLYGSGLRTSVVTPNDLSLPGYAVVNASLAQKIPIGLGKGTQVRFDVINLFDNSYQIRDGAGVGVGAPSSASGARSCWASRRNSEGDRPRQLAPLVAALLPGRRASPASDDIERGHPGARIRSAWWHASNPRASRHEEQNR